MIIKAKQLSKIYGSNNNKVIALNNVNLEINSGEFVSVIGPSGSGKSTLLHILSGLDNPTSGQVLLDDKDIYKHTEKELSALRRKSFGFVFQQFNLLPVLTASENISMPVLLDKKQPDKGYLNEISSLLGIADRLNHLPHELSGGQQQRVAIARAIVNRPTVLIADEPTGNLDPNTSKDIVDLFKHINNFGTTVIMVTHNMDIVTYLNKRVIELKDGRVLSDNMRGAEFNEAWNNEIFL